MRQRTVQPRNITGLSMVELLVATAITLIGLLVIAQVFSVYEGWKRTTTGVAQTQEGGLMGAFSIEQDLRHAGFGLLGLGCASINAYNENAVPQMFSLSALPATITPDSPAVGSDRVNVLYSTSAVGNIPATLQVDMASSSNALTVDRSIGFSSGDLIVISQSPLPPQMPPPCTLVQITGQPAVGGPNVTGPGSSWALPHAPGSLGPWNPPGGQNIAPPDGYATGAKVLNLGRLIDHTYYVENTMLRMDERSPVDGRLTSYDLIPGVVGLRVQYGRDTNDDGAIDLFDNDTAALSAAGGKSLMAIRFGVIVRSGNREKEPVIQKPIVYWPDGPELVLSDEDRHYRYSVFQTIVPLKNIIWNQ